MFYKETDDQLTCGLAVMNLLAFTYGLLKYRFYTARIICQLIKLALTHLFESAP